MLANDVVVFNNCGSLVLEDGTGVVSSFFEQEVITENADKSATDAPIPIKDLIFVCFIIVKLISLFDVDYDELLSPEEIFLKINYNFQIYRELFFYWR